MRTIKLTLAYDGTDYVGWQQQAEGRSVQEEVERAVAEIEGRPVRVNGAGRTDAGVHALGQVASARIAHTIDCATLVRALNAKLPDDIRVLCADDTADHFHARFSARGKTYRYQIDTGDVADPFLRRYAWRVAEPLDLGAMRAAAAVLVGKHDVAAFQAAGTDVGSTVRTIHRIGVDPHAPMSPLGARGVLIRVTGDGFLRHMVRIVVGTLVEVGTGRRPAADMSRILASRDRNAAGPTAPPRGLVLASVDYS